MPFGTRIEIARADFDGKHGVARRVHVEDASAFDDEPDFVLVVPVLAS